MYNILRFQNYPYSMFSKLVIRVTFDRLARRFPIEPYVCAYEAQICYRLKSLISLSTEVFAIICQYGIGDHNGVTGWREHAYLFVCFENSLQLISEGCYFLSHSFRNQEKKKLKGNMWHLIKCPVLPGALDTA
uniref:Uncharacterized protein n=1 Tax=Trichuris muris TaxID=70415 RepID=A0A5S6QDF8_TRIMR